MRVSIAQPAYLPWFGYFHRIAHSDLHISLDTVQMDGSSKTNFLNRNRILTANGPLWLSVPIRRKGLREAGTVIREIEVLSEENWRSKHLNSIRQSYAKAPFAGELLPFLEAFYAKEWRLLMEPIEESTSHFLKCLKIGTKIVKASSLKTEGASSELILSLCREVGATTYISGPFGRDYLDAAAFASAGIALEIHEFDHPSYPQLGRNEFAPYLSILDLLFNRGNAGASEVLRATPYRAGAIAKS